MSVRAYVELSRGSNIPTCVTNVLVGCALGGSLAWRPVLIMSFGVVLMYVAGMALNDAFDAGVDAGRRPGRPVPSGRVPRGAAFAYGLALLVAGLAVTAVFGDPLLAVILAACILLYDALHHKIAACVVLMGACRGLVYPLAASAVTDAPHWPAVGWLAGSMAAYVTVVTLNARAEAGEANEAPGLVRSLAILLPIVPSAAIVGVRPESPMWALLMLAAMVAWLARSGRFALMRPPRMKAAVMGWLSGICLVDAFFLALLDAGPAAVLIALACFALTALGHRVIVGT